MAMRVGLGPVFHREWLVRSRRFSLYATRSLFVAVLLLFICLVCWDGRPTSGTSNLRDFARLGEQLFYTITYTQLTLVLIFAPAFTAGALCQDKVSGALAQLLVTDLSDSEIVLGKLAAGLLNVLGLVACTLPVCALASLLGGIDPIALNGAFLVAIGTAVLCATVAFTLSVWGQKLHEVLLGTYFLLLTWIASPLVIEILRSIGLFGFTSSSIPRFFLANPYVMIAASREIGVAGPLLGPTYRNPLLFFAVCMGLSLLLTLISILSIRRVTVAHLSGGRRRRRREPRSDTTPLGNTRPAAGTPAAPIRRAWLLDSNPALWLARRRRRFSWWGRFVWGSYLAATVAALLLCLYIVVNSRNSYEEVCLVFSVLLLICGLLLHAVLSASTLAEERATGNLDILLTTPMATKQYVTAQWRSLYRAGVIHALAPVAIAILITRQPERFLIAVPLLIGTILGFIALLTSVGLFFAVRVPRVSRALGYTLCILTILVLGVVMLGASIGEDGVSRFVISGSPLVTVVILSISDNNSGPDWMLSQYLYALTWIGINLVAAVVLLQATVDGFDHWLGRISDPTEEKRVLGRIGSRPAQPRTIDASMLEPTIDESA